MNKPRGRPFEPGNSFGKGRPKGSRNKNQAPGQHILDQYGEHVLHKCVALALQGHAVALRLCMERISPARREAYIRLNLPAIESAQDVNCAADQVTQAIRRGQMTPSQGATMMHLLERRSRVIERADFESRLLKVAQELEAIQAARNS